MKIYRPFAQVRDVVCDSFVIGPTCLCMLFSGEMVLLSLAFLYDLHSNEVFSFSSLASTRTTGLL